MISQERDRLPSRLMDIQAWDRVQAMVQRREGRRGILGQVPNKQSVKTVNTEGKRKDASE